MKVGIISYDDGQGDATVTIVDEERWAQIRNTECGESAIFRGKPCPSSHDRYVWQERILYYTLEDISDTTPPEGTPPPVGRIVASCHAQNGVFEDADIGPIHIIGVLTLA